MHIARGLTWGTQLLIWQRGKNQNGLKYKLKHARTSIWFTNLSANTCSDNCKVVQIQILSLWREGQGERRFNSYAPNTNPHITTIYIYIHNYCLLHCSKLQFGIEDLEYINYIRQRHSAHICILHRCLPCLPHSANEIIIFAYKTPTRFCLLCSKFQFRRETKWNAQFYSHLIFFAHLKSNNNFTLV